jgi:hypothetical protein
MAIGFQLNNDDSLAMRMLDEWIPEKMDPGTIFCFEKPWSGTAADPYVAALSCPRCGIIGVITRRQLCGEALMICGGDDCSAEYARVDENFVFRKPQ